MLGAPSQPVMKSPVRVKTMQESGFAWTSTVTKDDRLATDLSPLAAGGTTTKFGGDGPAGSSVLLLVNSQTSSWVSRPAACTVPVLEEAGGRRRGVGGNSGGRSQGTGDDASWQFDHAAGRPAAAAWRECPRRQRCVLGIAHRLTRSGRGRPPGCTTTGRSQYRRPTRRGRCTGPPAHAAGHQPSISRPCRPRRPRPRTGCLGSCDQHRGRWSAMR